MPRRMHGTGRVRKGFCQRSVARGLWRCSEANTVAGLTRRRPAGGSRDQAHSLLRARRCSSPPKRVAGPSGHDRSVPSRQPPVATRGGNAAPDQQR